MQVVYMVETVWKYAFVVVIQYQSNIIFWAKGFLLTSVPETDPLAVTASYVSYK